MSEYHNHNIHTVDKKLQTGILLSLTILAAEIAGGILSNSLALLADAGHVMTDILALGLTSYGIRQARKPSSATMTYGYHRVGVIIAVANALSIIAIAGIILYEAIQRFRNPRDINSDLMLIIAVIGLAANLFVAWRLRQESHGNLNIKSAFWHAGGDALASIGVIAGSISIAISGWNMIDPIVSIVISFIIVIAGWGILKEGLYVLLEGTPHHIDLKQLVSTLRQLPGVKDVHDLHVWSITPSIHALSCHIYIDDQQISQAETVRHEIECVLEDKFKIKHSTLQLECRQCDTGEMLCQMQADEATPSPDKHKH
jgi:cobalt-zinc-cadmium efflux system protein